MHLVYEEDYRGHRTRHIAPDRSRPRPPYRGRRRWWGHFRLICARLALVELLAARVATGSQEGP